MIMIIMLMWRLRRCKHVFFYKKTFFYKKKMFFDENIEFFGENAPIMLCM